MSETEKMRLHEVIRTLEQVRSAVVDYDEDALVVNLCLSKKQFADFYRAIGTLKDERRAIHDLSWIYGLRS